MTTATIHRRPWLPALNLFLAVTAVVISVLALATTPEEVTEVITHSPSVNVSPDPADNLPTAVAAQRTPPNPSTNPLLPGCNLGFGRC